MMSKRRLVGSLDCSRPSTHRAARSRRPSRRQESPRPASPAAGCGDRGGTSSSASRSRPPADARLRRSSGFPEANCVLPARSGEEAIRRRRGQPRGASERSSGLRPVPVRERARALANQPRPAAPSAAVQPPYSGPPRAIAACASFSVVHPSSFRDKRADRLERTAKIEVELAIDRIGAVVERHGSRIDAC